LKLGIIDEVIPEPLGGAHSDWDQAAGLLKASVLKHLGELSRIPVPELVDQRYGKFAGMGQFSS
jgi:acetyl-CoA carboxylase carboxyl transferase subunit alpha